MFTFITAKKLLLRVMPTAKEVSTCKKYVVIKNKKHRDVTDPAHMSTYDKVRFSVAVLAEISLRSPRKLFLFIIKKIIFRIRVSQKKKLNFEKKITGKIEIHT